MKKIVAIIIILVLSVSACSKPEEKVEEAKVESLGDNIYENKILMLRRNLDLLAEGKTSYDDVVKYYKSIFKETLVDKAVDKTAVVRFIISMDIVQKLDKEKAALDFVYTKILLSDYEKKSKKEIDKVQKSMIEFAKKYNVKIYKHFNKNIVFSEPIEDTSGYNTHKVFFKEKLAENYVLCGWYIFDKDDKILSYNVLTCEDKQEQIEYYLKAKVKFKE